MNADVASVPVAEEPGVANLVENRALDALVAANNFKRRDKIRRDVALRIDDKNKRRRADRALAATPRCDDKFFNFRLFRLFFGSRLAGPGFVISELPVVALEV